MNLFSKKKNYISLFILLVLALAVYIYLDINFGPVVTICYVTAFFIIIFLFAMYAVKNEKELNSRCMKTNEKLNKVYKKSNKLLKVFTLYFDNSYVLIHNILKEGMDVEDVLKNINIADQFKQMFDDNAIEDYIELSLNEVFTGKNPQGFEHVCDEMDFFSTEIDVFLNIVKSVENSLYIDAKERVSAVVRKERFKKMVVEYDFYSELISEFIFSITNSINATSKPLSEEILTIKTSLSLFLKIVTSWKENLVTGTSDRNIKTLMAKYSEQNDGFEQAFTNINEHYSDLDNDLKVIVSMIDRIYENSGQIEDIAEKINLLSINASIESIRAGASGRGFKVIAQEVHKLSENTRLFTKDIVGLIKETKQVAGNAINKFNEGCGSITRNLSDHKSRFAVLYNHLKDYYNDFNTIFLSVMELTTDINFHINSFNPVFQLFDISIQQLDNVNKMITRYLSDNQDEREAIMLSTSKETRLSILNKLIAFVEENITTSMEIDVLEKMAQEHGVDKHVQRENVNIEIF